MKVGIYTLGCKVNAYESEYISKLFEKHGYEIADFNDVCDIYIINTCSVTNQSDSKSRKIIREAIRRNKDACVVAMGCFIEANKDCDIEGLNIKIGTKGKGNVLNLVEKYLQTKENIDYFEELTKEFEDMDIKTFGSKTRAFVKIQDGCENFCTYCIIPYVRGKCCSKSPKNVISEITSLVNNGYKEIVLTGIHTGSYGVDLDYSFASLLKEIIKIPDLYRLRISSIEVTELNSEVLDIIKNSKIICNHLHIPLQAGSNEILKLMNRKYDLDYFKNKIDEIRSIRPNIAISTDIIVGFPNETDDMFNNTLSFSKEIGFSKIHVFPYSERKNTPAAKFKDKVEPNIKKDRCNKLLNLSKALEINYMKKFINKEVEVLIEKSTSEVSMGHTSNYLNVKIDGMYDKEEIVLVKIVDINYPYVIGKVVK